MIKMDPFRVLLAFGIAMIVCGAVYRTPIPVQPIKAAGSYWLNKKGLLRV